MTIPPIATFDHGTDQHSAMKLIFPDSDSSYRRSWDLFDVRDT